MTEIFIFRTEKIDQEGGSYIVKVHPHTTIVVSDDDKDFQQLINEGYQSQTLIFSADESGQITSRAYAFLREDIMMAFKYGMIEGAAEIMCYGSLPKMEDKDLVYRKETV